MVKGKKVLFLFEREKRGMCGKKVGLRSIKELEKEEGEQKMGQRRQQREKDTSHHSFSSLKCFLVLSSRSTFKLAKAEKKN